METETLLVVRDLESLQRAKDYLRSAEFDFVAFDTETTGLQADCEMVGFSFAAEEDVGVYVVLAEWKVNYEQIQCAECEGAGCIIPGYKKNGKPKKPRNCKACDCKGYNETFDGEIVRHDELKQASRELFEILLTKRLIMHNSPFDIKTVNREMGIDLLPALHTDTLELFHVLDENERVGLKEIGARELGEDATIEQALMKASVLENGGKWTKENKEMYKADSELFGRYGAKDTILTLRIFNIGIPRLFDEALDKFFFDEESMPLMKTATYELNSVGIRVDLQRITELQKELEDNIQRLRREIEEIIKPLVEEKYPNGFGKGPGKFNMTASQQMAWLLFGKCEEYFLYLTDGGKVKAKDVLGKLPYSLKDKRTFVTEMEALGENPYKYMKCDAEVLEKYADDHEWCKKLLDLRGEEKILSTYVMNIRERMRYGIIYPSFNQAGTVTGRYSSNAPNFQNLPRTDKRVKSCLIARPGKVLVGADQSQLEARVFASVSQDARLMRCFEDGYDFYSVIGVELFADKVKEWEARTGKKIGLSKKDENYFGKIFEAERDVTKAFALATPYGTSAYQQSQKLKRPQAECQILIDTYFEGYPAVEAMMLESHELVKRDGVVYTIFGRPRRLPEAKNIKKQFGNMPHGDLPSNVRTLLNAAMNFRVQGLAGSIMNRASIAFCQKIKQLGLSAKYIMQVHDEIIVECDENEKDQVAAILKDCMENTVTLPGVKLQAVPVIATRLSDLK